MREPLDRVFVFDVEISVDEIEWASPEAKEEFLRVLSELDED